MISSNQTRQLLDIDKILKFYSKHVRSEIGRKYVENIKPLSNIEMLREGQALYREFERYIDIKGDFPWDDRMVLVNDFLDEGKSRGILFGEELLPFRYLLGLTVRIKELSFDLAREGYERVAQRAREFADFGEEVVSLSVLDDDGWLYDSASSKLAEIRGNLAAAKRQARAIGQKILSDQSLTSKLQDQVITLRNDRYVVLVKKESAPSFPGVFVDYSSSGNSVYMEPNALVAINNKIAMLREDERQEERRILQKLTEMLLAREKAILRAQDLIGQFDLLWGIYYFLQAHDWILPEIEQKSGFYLTCARHPLLGPQAVPIDVHCGRNFRALVITGPNTGGKTVALKTVGLCVYLAWCGLPIPAKEGSRIGHFSHLEADIGDEQSIEQNLSTFSGHVKRIIEMLEIADEASLFLIDELGAGTDPDEGAALGIAILETFLKHNSLVLATTHHNPIKRYALTTPKVETASVDFDPETLLPKYKLLLGVPGRSNALLIAKRLGMPESVLEIAERELKTRDTSMEELMEKLQTKLSMLEEKERELAKETAKINAMRKELERQLAAIEMKREHIMAEAEKKAKDIIKEAQESAKLLLKELRKTSTLREAHKRFAEHKKRTDKILRDVEQRELARIERRSSILEGKLPKVGDEVVILGTNATGTIERIDDETATVQSGPMRLEVSLRRLRVLEETSEQKEKPAVKISVEKPKNVPSTLIIRGMRVNEAIPTVETYLDKAFRAGYKEVTIVHGHGEGILRQEVHELCKRLQYIEEFSLGGPGEGGHGVTIVRFVDKGSS